MRKGERDEHDKTIRLMADHAVPLSWIAEELKDEGLWRRGVLRDFLLHHFRRGVLTKLEDERLNATRVGGTCLKDDMPPAWKRGGFHLPDIRP